VIDEVQDRYQHDLTPWFARSHRKEPLFPENFATPQNGFAGRVWDHGIAKCVAQPKELLCIVHAYSGRLRVGIEPDFHLKNKGFPPCGS
jgi:hypothetical protein